MATTGKRHIVTTQVEHASILALCQQLATEGVRITHLPVNTNGSLALSDLAAVVTPETAIVTIMMANNETGALFPIKEASQSCQKQGVLFHTDTAQAADKIPLDVTALDVDFCSLSAHKLHGLKGNGALYIKGRTQFSPLLRGGHQEKGCRGGTKNIPGLVAFGKAAELAAAHLADNLMVEQLRNQLEQGILENIPGAHRNGGREPRLPNTTNLRFDQIDAQTLLQQLSDQELYASSGSACATGATTPSHVLLALGLTPTQARSAIRLSLSRFTTPQQVEQAIHILKHPLQRLRPNTGSHSLAVA